MVFNKIKKAFSVPKDEETLDDEYVEIDLEQEKKQNKVLVKLYTLRSYEETTDILNALREGYTIAIVDIKVLRQKDPIELKRSISKIKKTTDAIEGSIAGFGENTVIVTPSFAKIQKEASRSPKEDSSSNRFD